MTETKEKKIIEIPELCLVALIGASASGKSTFAAKHFLPTEILSSDFFRSMISDNESDQSVSSDAFELLYAAAGKRLDYGKLTVVDATNLQPRARTQVLQMAREKNVHAVAIVFDLPEKILQERNAARTDHVLPARKIQSHCQNLKKSLRYIKKEGFRYVYTLGSVDEIDSVEIVRTKMRNNKKDEHGPFDIIGDIHGCATELKQLLSKLGYVNLDGTYIHPEGRKAVFLGDFCDRGPRNAEVLRIAMDMVKKGSALAVPGNHDAKLIKYLKGRQIQIAHGIDKTIEQLEAEGQPFKDEVLEFLEGLVSHYVLDDGKLIVAHAGIKKEYIGRSSGKVHEFCLYGETTGETDKYGLPVTLNWAADYNGKAQIVYGHIAGLDCY